MELESIFTGRMRIKTHASLFEVFRFFFLCTWVRKTDLRRVATTFNSVLRATAALSPPVEMELLQSVGVVQRASLDHCGG